MAVTACLLSVLNTLSTSALSGLCGVLQGLSIKAQAEVVKLQIQALKYDFIANTVQKEQEATDAALAGIENSLSFFPVGVGLVNLQDCPQLGDFLTAPQVILASLRNRKNELSSKLRSVTSMDTLLGNKIARLQVLDQLAVDVCTVITSTIIPGRGGA